MRIKTVSFCIIAYNEKNYIQKILEDLIEQTYPKSLIEVILVDGMSTDNTKYIMGEFKETYQEKYKDIIILNNYKRVQPTGWNIAISSSTQEVVLRIDAHAQLPKKFIENNMKCINSGEFICGGARENIIDSNELWKKTLLAAEQSMFGSSIAPYRKSKGKKYVKSIFHGAYRREVFEKVGLFNEFLLRTEDNEFHYRTIKYGYKICYDPEIISYYQTRNSLTKMIKQKYMNGYWIGKTLFVCKDCIALYHIVPFLFLLAIQFSIVFSLIGVNMFICLLFSVYSSICILIAIIEIMKTKNILNICLPVLFFLLHIFYGIGTCCGLVSGMKKENLEIK